MVFRNSTEVVSNSQTNEIHLKPIKRQRVIPQWLPTQADPSWSLYAVSFKCRPTHTNNGWAINSEGVYC